MPDKNEGGRYALYVLRGPSAPSSPEAVGEYTLLGFRKGTGLSQSGSNVDLSDSESTVREMGPGRPGAVITGTFNHKTAGDAGVDILRNAQRDKETVYWLLTPLDIDNSTQTVGGLQHYGSGYVNEVSYNHPDLSPSEVSIGIDVNGTYTTDHVAT